MKTRFRLVWIFFIIFVLLIGHASSVVSQSLQWPKPQRIPGYADDGEPPLMVADQNQTVHAFRSQPAGGDLVIVYSNWTLTRGWSTPVDILLSPLYGIARLGGVALDEKGVIHVAYFGGNDFEAAIYYSQAPAIWAGDASAWSTPKIVGESADTPATVSLNVDDEGNIVVVYSGRSEDNGLYSVHSMDNGETWTRAKAFFLTYSEVLWPIALKTMFDSQGRLHATWSVVNTTGNSEVVYHSRLSSDFEAWTRATDVATVTEFEADTPAIIEYEGDLIIIYHNGFPTTRWMRRSSDGGDTWTEPIRVFPGFVGSNGPASMVVDSAGTLHMFFGNRTGGDTYGMWHSIWQGTHWGEPRPVVAGPRVVGRLGGNGFDPSTAHAILSQGSTLLLTWRTDPGAGPNGVWYTHTVLDAPTQEIAPLPTPTATPEIVAELSFGNNASLPSSQSDSSSQGNFDTIVPEAESNLATPILVGIISVVVLLAIIFTIYRARLLNRH